MDDLISEFIAETSESLSELDLELVRLEKNPDDDELLGNIFRLVHTIKGTCGFLGLPRLESVAHAGENVLGKVRDKEMEVTPEVVSIILESFDTIKQIMEHIEETGEEPEGDDSDLIQRLNSMAGMEENMSAEAFDEAISRMEEAEASEGGAAEEHDDVIALPSDGEAGVDDDAQDGISEEDAVADASLESANDDQQAGADLADGDDSEQESAEGDGQEQAAIDAGLKANEPDKPQQKRPSKQSIRVNLDVLEELMQMVSELVLTRNQLLQLSRNNGDSELLTPLQRLSHITSELQDGVMKTRMQPISNAWSKFPRVIRDLSIELGKQIELHMVGEETELDRQLLEMIKDPLTHMVRNSCDHGLETPEVRTANGKPETGNVTLRAYHEGGHIIIEIEDDGHGIDSGKIADKAVSKGLATREQVDSMTENQILQFIFAPGFSTAEKVTSVSGRGVGMDVVRSNIEKIGGAVELKSHLGKGSLFRIKIPLTLAIVSVLIVESHGERFAIPQINVLEMVQASPQSEYRIERINHAPVMRLRNKLLPMVTLGNILGREDQDAIGERINRSSFVVVCNVGGYDFGVVVDRVYDTEEIVVKPLVPLLQEIDIYSGCTILGDGSVIMILDPNGVARHTGEVQISDGQDADEDNVTQRYSERRIKFLLFSTMDETPKAVPLDIVSRLEEIEVEKVEHSGKSKVVQYRGNLMRLVSLDEEWVEFEPGLYQVIVFNYEDKVVGLVVKDILDIVESKLNVQMASDDEKMIGSMVLEGRTTDVIDVGNLVTEVLGSMAEQENALKTSETSRQTILLVDDSAFFRNLTAPFLSSRGFEVIVSEGANEALKMLDEGLTVDIIVSDIEMPQINGIEFARICRTERGMNGLPMIALTSNMRPEVVKKGLEAGFNAYISKTDRDGLLREITQVLHAS